MVPEKPLVACVGLSASVKGMFSSTSATLHQPLTSARLFELLTTAGGFTIRRRSGTITVRGVCVATRPHAELSFPAQQWDGEAVDRWLNSLQGERPWRASHIGGWIDPSTGEVVLDIVRVVPRRLRVLAWAVGRWTRQDYAFDLSKRTVMVFR